MIVENLFSFPGDYHDDLELLAILIRNSKEGMEEGIKFFTQPNDSQQVATIKHPKGYSIPRHSHLPRVLQATKTQEILIILQGKIRVDFYSSYQESAGSREIGEGDILVLLSGGHGMTVLEEVSMIEVKTGPYQGENDKWRF